MAAAADLLHAVQNLSSSLQQLDQLSKSACQLCEDIGAQARGLERSAAAAVSKTSALQTAAGNIRAAQQRASEVLEHLDTSRKVQGVVRAGPRADLDAFLRAVSQLEAALDFLQRHRSMHTAADALVHTQRMYDDAIQQCTTEFTSLLRQQASPLPLEPAAAQALARERSASSKDGAGLAAAGATTAAGDLSQDAAVVKLRQLAETLMKHDARACARTYVDIRRGVVGALLERQLAPFASKEELGRLGWEQLESRIPGWTAALRSFVRVVQHESKLCSAMLRPADQAAVLAQVAAPAAATLLEGAGAMRGAKRAPEKIYGLLEMHAAAEAALPLLRAAGPGSPAALTRASVARPPGGSPRSQSTAAPALAPAQLPTVDELAALRDRLAAEARACFNELQQVVAAQEVGGGAAPPDGTVHPMCASVVATMKRVLSHATALPVLLGSRATRGSSGGEGLQEEAGLLDRMSAAVSQVLDALLAGLEARARGAYRSPAQAALHMANNSHFLLRTIAGSKELKAVSESWWELHQGTAERYAKQYEEAATTPVLALMRTDLAQPAPANVTSDKAARQACKDRWSAVNKALGELATHAAWAVPDAALRYAIKDALAGAILPLYERFFNKYKAVPFSEQRGKYVRWTPQALATAMQGLFEGADSVAALSASASMPRGNSFSRRVSSMRRGTGGSQNTP